MTGYHDHHLHPFGYASLVNGLELMDAVDLDEVMAKVVAHGDRVEGPIIGQRLNDEGVTDLRLPTAADIDDVVADRPVLLYRYCGHIAVANSAAMRLAGLDSDTEDPLGGSFDRDDSGRPNGILRETAINSVSQALEGIVKAPSDLEIISALARLRQMGIVSITGMVSVTANVWCGVDDEVATLVRLAPDLPIDIDVLLIASTPADFLAAKEHLDKAEGPVRSTDTRTSSTAVSVVIRRPCTSRSRTAPTPGAPSATTGEGWSRWDARRSMQAVWSRSMPSGTGPMTLCSMCTRT